MIELTGWVKLHRKYLKNPIWFNDPDNRVFLWLLLAAAHKPRTERVGSREIPLKRGQMITSQSEIGAGTRLSRKPVRLALQRLVRERTIRCEYPAGPKSVTLVTIVNYPLYQGEEVVGVIPEMGPRSGPRSGPRKKEKSGQDENAPNIFNYQELAARNELSGAKPKTEIGPRTGPRMGPCFYKEEEVKEDQEIPPYPPQNAGGRVPGDCSSTNLILRMWCEVREEAGQAYAEDRRTRRGAELLAEHWLDSNIVTMEQLRGAMRNLVREIIKNPKARLFDLRTLDGGLSKYLNPVRAEQPQGKRIMWCWTCNKCGETAVGNRLESAGTPAPTPCIRGKAGCDGKMLPQIY